MLIPNKMAWFVLSDYDPISCVTLSDILGFPTKVLLVKHLGVPITGRTIRHLDYEFLILSLQAFIARWEGKNLSYNG